MAIEWIQHMLTRKVGKTLQVRLCWIQMDKRVKEGSIITLKGEKTRWEVTRQFKDLRTNTPPRQDWKVGGLF